MNRIPRWSRAVVLIVLALISPLLLPQEAPAAERPNILILNMDDARFDALSYMSRTRNIMSSSVSFTQARVAIPSCCPSRSVLFSGRYSHNNGVRHQADTPSFDSEHSTARYLKGAGYMTAMSGKFLNQWPLTTRPPYFDKSTVINGGYYDYAASIEGVVRRSTLYSTTFLGNQLRSYLSGFEAQDSTPWLAYFATTAPHTVTTDTGEKLAVPESKYANAAVGQCVQPSPARPTVPTSRRMCDGGPLRPTMRRGSARARPAHS